MVIIFIYSLPRLFAVISASNVLQSAGLAYMRVFVKFIILGPFFRVSLHASIYGK